ncbi:hypothetical protein SAMN05216421_1054 [Halopseudomonas xinjiangensis]|uniref:EF hand n=1 Tax=Halopseudomonas xinjiangensis TaxID=487184 RepID=A0A1H1Q4S8_9GAMM|nr:hypothetical protein [Halopseudomonas xinjiangensis]SDS18257.1 hypothetical protein SAMN05216421_1054 [Halopseudomonas xinjiangensis]
MKSLSTALLSGIALSLVIAAGAHAQSTGPDFSNLDANGSGEIEFDEFHHEHSDGDEPPAEQTDAEHDGFGYDTGDFDALEGRDLDQTLFERYDADNSRGLDRDEYQEYQDNVTRRLRDF